MRYACFIAGTDTGIGKTHASCTLLHALRHRGLRATGMKPVASGCLMADGRLLSEDAQALRVASSAPLPAYARSNPVALREPLSPHLAAAHDGVAITLPALRTAFDALCADHDAVVVEGVGGWRVPLAPGLDASEIPRAWRLPVIFVVGLKLGCLNHTLLSVEAIRADGCTLAGWIGNRIDPDMDAVDENLATLRERVPAPCLGVLPHGVAPAEAAGALDLSHLGL